MVCQQSQMLPEETRNLFGDAVRSGALLKAAGSARVCGRLQRGIVTLRAVIEKKQIQQIARSRSTHEQPEHSNHRRNVKHALRAEPS